MAPSKLSKMIECKDSSKAKALILEHGYALLRNFIPRTVIQKARSEILERLVQLDRIKSVNDTSIINGDQGVFMFDKHM